ncbi:PepSY-associated TM helix domain-containing protein [Aureimonas pseudogalii]|uniref:Putative iron-regulated membrane protein n=1 Tax=Aureimonas pseudogalii TaxID=1744844 RepID=A0A7W6H6H7_9HYPH|nr:PepSY domain-containing protein [Aureimonas pseudogalii]MBB3999485.1 putative iron-regulated membrane protein [Aureimonas pseudogalii]
MSDLTLPPAARTARPPAAAADLYRAVWRWHFYAGLFVLPFLVTLSLTGALYLFRDEIEAVVHADLKRVAITEGAPGVAPSAMIASALAARPGTAVKFTTPAGPGASAEITVKAADGERLAVYVDPQDGRVLGSLPDRGTVMWLVRSLHSLSFFGPVARGVIEIAAGWAILLVLTGIYLWWPRGRTGGVVTVRGTARTRVFWRDLHAVTGLGAGGILVFLAITGMPWSQVWGGQVNQWANGSNFGYPAGVRVDVPMSGRKLAEDGSTSWSLAQAQVPTSGTSHGSHGAHGSHGEAMPDSAPAAPTPFVGIDRAVARFDALGLHGGYAVNLPAGPTGVYTGSVYPDDLAAQRVVHLDAYTGEPLLDMSYADYGPMGRALEWGINVHLGQQYGLANQLVLLAACLANVLLAVSAAIMWWKRRPARAMGVPPMPRDPRVLRGLVALLAVGGLIFPLMGASLLAMLAIDRAVAHFGGAGPDRREPA